MSNKRNRASGNKSRSGSRGGSGSGGGRQRTAAETQAAKRRAAANKTAPRGGARGRDTGRRPARARLFPPEGAVGIAASAELGLRTTIGSIPLVALCIVAPLVLWAGMAALGAPPASQAMNEALGMPPVQSTLAIATLLLGAQIPGGRALALIGFGFQIVFYAVFMTVAISLALSAQDGEPVRTAVRRAWAYLKVRWLWMIVVELGFVSVSLLLIFLPLLLGTIGYPIGLMFTIYFTVFVAPAVVVNGMPGRDALRASFAVARIVRSNHAVLVGVYVLFIIVVVFTGPGVAGVVTPTIAVWVYALIAGLLHTAMLSIFVHRWRVLSPAVLGPAPDEDEAVPATETSR